MLITFERLISLRRRRVVPRLFVERFLLQIREGALDRHEALEKCDEEPSYIAQVFAAAIRKWGKPAVEVEQAVLDEGERVANVLRKYLRVVNGISTVSPLLGLAGTVWGMMHAFSIIATNSAMGRAEMLAGGISVALVTTASGTDGGDPGDGALHVLRGPRRQPGDGDRLARAGAGESDLG